MDNIADFLKLLQSGGMPPATGMPQTAMPDEAPQNDLVQQILSSRFQEPSLHDTANATFEGALAHKYVDPSSYAANDFASSLDELNKLSQYQANLAKTKLYASGGTGSNGATMQIIQGLMSSNPGMTFDQALYQYQTGNRAGTKLTSNGIEPVPGAENTKILMNKAGSAGTEQGKINTEAQANLPTVIDNAQTSIDVINEALIHPGLNANFGMTGMVPNRPGSAAADAGALLEQIKGGGFLTAYGQLRGGGQISNVEGDKATAAYVRMQKAQSAEAFRKAAKEYVGIIQKGVNRARNAATGVNFNQGAMPVSTSTAKPVILQGGNLGNGDVSAMSDEDLLNALGGSE